MKVSDEYTVPLCRGHHRQLHQAGNEVKWWEGYRIQPLEIAKRLWEQTHPKSEAVTSETSTSRRLALLFSKCAPDLVRERFNKIGHHASFTSLDKGLHWHACDEVDGSKT